MSFRLFIYYCALCGGCAAYLGWAMGRVAAGEDPIGQAGIKGMFLGLLVALGLGLVDMLWNFSLGQFLPATLRIIVAVMVGAVGGLMGGMLGQLFYGRLQLSVFLILGWTITGLLIGASVGVFDVMNRLLRNQDL